MDARDTPRKAVAERIKHHIGTRLGVETVEQVLAVYAETNNGLLTAARLNLKPARVYKIIHASRGLDDYENFRTMMRIECIEKVWPAMVVSAEQLAALVKQSTNADFVLKATERLARIVQSLSGIMAENSALVAAARKPDVQSMVQHGATILDPNAIAAGIRAAQQASGNVQGPGGNGSRISEVRG